MKSEIDGTGGGPPKSKALTHIDQKILNIVSPIVIDGAPEVVEPGICSGGQETIYTFAEGVTITTTHNYFIYLYQTKINQFISFF